MIQVGNQKLIELAATVEKWVARTCGEFSSESLAKENLIDNVDIRNQIIDDLLRREIIEHVGRRHGYYQRIDCDDTLYDWMSCNESYYPLLLPLGISDMCRVSPGNVVLVAGQTNAGKSSFVHVTNHMNLKSFGGGHENINLFISEGGHEIKRRLLSMNPDYTLWDGLNVRLRRGQYHSSLKDNELNVVDYLKVHKDFTEVAVKLEKIGAAVPNGCAIVAMQMKRGEDAPRGGDFGLEECRLAVALMYDRETQVRTCRIIKCKFPVDAMRNPEGMEIDFNILPNGFFQPLTGWEYVDETKRKKRRRDALYARKREFNSWKGY